MKKYIYLFMVICFGALTSCLKDNTSLIQKVIPTVDSLFIEYNGIRTDISKYLTSVSAVYGENIVIDPEVYFGGPETLVYEWLVDGKTVSNEKILDYNMNIDGTSGALVLKITREGANNSEYFSVNLTLREPYNLGVAILAKKDGVTQLHYLEQFKEVREFTTSSGGVIRTEHIDYILHENAYEKNNGEPLMGTKPVGLGFYSSMTVSSVTANKNLKALTVLDEDASNVTNIDVKTLKKETPFSGEFLGEMPASLSPSGFVSSGPTNYVMSSDGKVYYRINYNDFTPFSGRYSPLPLNSDGEELNITHLAYNPYIKYAQPMYDGVNNKFYLVISAESTSYDIARSANVYELDNYSTMNDGSKEMVSSYNSGSMFGTKVANLLKAEDGKYYMQICSYSYSSYSETLSFSLSKEYEFPFSNLLNDNSKFSYSMNKTYDKSETLFYTSDSALYYYDGANKTQARKIAQMESNITKVLATDVWNEGTSSSAQTLIAVKGSRVCVALENGDVVMLRLTANPQSEEFDVVNDVTEEIRFTAGEVIDMVNVI